ncbi:dihydroanticapsin dehydrogenase [Evansella caseinilytica]|uniref:Dihydroanticapsin dehydrogenase n=1 Tax=Evansella caseinilytica TaxID=1503961 RepID=A0A1H3G399_9BACI|nr:glucose 1-dehydrogenase [Evansella caseinilytica]SDX97783.1 dihydroanticapsin dehydrogenase [Evansella caseinilytica]
MTLKNKNAVITGGASGIGLATVTLFAEHGVNVVFADIDEQAGSELERKLTGDGFNVKFALSDVTDEDAVKQLFSLAGTIDILVNNVGIEIATPFHQMETAEWNRLLQVNLTSMFLCSKYAIQQMMKTDAASSIINVSSVSGTVAWPGIAAYNTTKGGVMMLTKSLAADYAKYNISVNCVCPSIVDTPMTDKSIGEENLEAIKREKARLVPLNRMCKPGDVANAILFLASEQAAFITGTPLMVDGGYTAV